MSLYHCVRQKNIFIQPKYLTSGDEGGMAMLQLGCLEEFQPEEDSIASYLERVELYFVANDTNSDKKVPVFLSAAGARTYSLLCDLLAPAKLKNQPSRC